MKLRGTTHFIMIGATTLLLCAGLAIPAAQAASTRKTSTAPAAKTFMQEAASGGLMEVELGKIAAQRASSSDVKEFGQRMVTDHTKANDELKDLASRKNVTLHEGLDAKQQAEVSRLSKLSGHEFDQSYMKTMTTDHEHDVAAFKKAASSSPDADVKSFASQTLPTLEDHLSNARRVEAEVNRTKTSRAGE
jgi:putative membrane protein